MSFFKRIFSSEKKETLDKGLEQTKTSFFAKLTKAVAGKSSVDDDVLDNLEEVLVSSDVGVKTTLKIIDRIEARVARDKYMGTDELNKILREEIAGLLSETNSGEATEFDIPSNKKPYVIMVVGVNGVGKTTTIGKLAYQFKKVSLFATVPYWFSKNRTQSYADKMRTKATGVFAQGDAAFADYSINIGCTVKF